MNSIESILLSLEGKCRMDISAPASKEDIFDRGRGKTIWENL